MHSLDLDSITIEMKQKKLRGNSPTTCSDAFNF